ncbi:hypothetical protein V493_03917 [Pseudogymnoascus sp. VKM F-4281 (FW-2241)]|nr:hypothetical protein V493_03917 [Pseudogymnoascus sp. VKM F-4281 (FW-2241)]
MNNAEEIVLLVNNLGSVSELEFGGISTQVVKALGSDEAAAGLSLDVHAFGVTVTNACKKLIDNEPSLRTLTLSSAPETVEQH